jgi:hypothetical protein
MTQNDDKSKESSMRHSKYTHLTHGTDKHQSHGHGGHGHHEERPVELHGKWKDFEETVPSHLKIAFVVLLAILITICYTLMRNKKGHHHH